MAKSVEAISFEQGKNWTLLDIGKAIGLPQSASQRYDLRPEEEVRRILDRINENQAPSQIGGGAAFAEADSNSHEVNSWDPLTIEAIALLSV